MYKRQFCFFFSEQSIVQEIFSLRSKLERKNKENEDLKTRQVQYAHAQYKNKSYKKLRNIKNTKNANTLKLSAADVIIIQAKSKKINFK